MFCSMLNNATIILKSNSNCASFNVEYCLSSGYMSPEYVTSGAFSVKSDTYSFGVLLLEIISGLKIISTQFITDFPNLIAYVSSSEHTNVK